MPQLFRLLIDLALVKKGPQDVPYSLFLFVFIFTVVFITDIIGLQIPGPKGQVYDFVDVIKFLVIANIVIYAAIYLVFYLQKLTNRYLQTITALAGIGLVLNFIQIPMNYIIVKAFVNELPGLVIMMSMLQMFLFGWLLFVNFNIFRQALSISMLYAVALSLGLFILSLYLQSALLPDLSP